MRAGRCLVVLLLVALAAACSQRPARVVYRTPGGTTTPAPVLTPLPSPPKVTAPSVPKVVAPVASHPARVVVKRGDTVYALARRYNVPVRAIIVANRLGPPYTLKVGQQIALPRERVHITARGETVYGIARAYGVDMSALARVNGLRAPYQLNVGQRLRIPAAPAASANLSKAALGPSATAALPAKTRNAAARHRTGAIPKPPPRTKSTFLWPVQGKLLARFGAKGDGLHNDGINISAPRGAAVRAAAAGVVSYAGNELGGYGNLLLIRHAGGWTTAYAHNETLLVRRGDTVRRGQIIARVGSSGGVSAPQAHFELRRGSRAVDPLKHLAWN
ncbi:MAG: peptidoglycan DD-metalloendopeptidase family protein [Alphaproteobacteria bacterium]